MRYLSLILTIVLAIATGCSSDAPRVAHKSASDQQRAAERWSDAQATVLIGLARDEFSNQNFEKSRETIDESIKLAPTNASARVLSARLYIEAGQLEIAERELTLARQLDPTNAEAEYLSGIVYQRWQQPQRALEFYQHACEKAPAELAYLMARAEMLVAMDQPAEALQLLQAKVTYFEHSGVIRDEVGLLLIQAQRYDEAAEMLRRACILAPDDQTIRQHLAMALFYAGQYSNAAEVLSQVLTDPVCAKRGELWATLGECHLQTGRAADAVSDYQQATTVSPNSAELWLGLAKAQLQADNLRGAEISVRRSLSIDSACSQAYLLMGYLDRRQSRSSDALAAFDKASKLDPSDTVSLCMIGLTLQELGRSAEAAPFYQRALSLNPHDEMAAQLMARGDWHEK